MSLIAKLVRDKIKIGLNDTTEFAHNKLRSRVEIHKTLPLVTEEGLLKSLNEYCELNCFDYKLRYLMERDQKMRTSKKLQSS